MGKTLQPSYRLVKRDGRCDIRAYEPMILAEVQVAGPRRKALNDGFSFLLDYILGKNDKGMKLAMTIPVTLQPVEDKSSGQQWIVRFILPPGSVLDQLPHPKEPRIALFRVPVARAAVIRFSGMASDAALRKRLTELRAWIKDQELIAAGPPTFAFYDPPWMPWFLRRNEILIGVEY